MGFFQCVGSRHCTAAAAIVLGFAVAHNAVASDDPILNGELGATLDDWLSRMEAFGMHGAILVEARGEVALAKGYGIAHHASGRQITHETSFHLGSLGKQFTAACILKLEMMGRLSVDDGIGEHLDDVPDDKASITIHHLLTHTSGLPYMPTAAPLELPLQFEPGERWAYSNPGYTLLGQIVARVGGVPLREFAAAHLFEPAGMKHTTFIGNPDWPTDDVAYSYQDDNDLGPVSGDEPDSRFLGAGDFASTVGDLLKWEHALQDESILDDDARAKFFTEHVRNPGSAVGYAYGWMTTTIPDRGTRLVFHQGNFGGFNSDYRRYVDEDVTIVFLSNHFLAGRSMRDAVVSHVSRLIHGDIAAVPMPPRVVALEDAGAGATVEATFPIGGDERIETKREVDALLLRGWGQRATHLIFTPEADEATRAFAEMASAQSVDAMRAAAGGDDSVLRANLSGSVMPDQLVDDVRRQLAAWLAELGPLTDATSLGAALTGQLETGRVTLRLTFERGERHADVAWTGGGIYQVTETDAPPARRFLPTSTGLAAFNIFTGARNDIAIESAADGWELTIGDERFRSTG